jgi:lysozyme
LSDEEAEYLLENDIQDSIYEASKFLGATFDVLSVDRQSVVVNMVFNMGIVRFSGFKKMVAALEGHDYNEAAAQMLDSKWARQVGNRATRLAKIMREG